MVSPRKIVHTKNKNEASKIHKVLEKYIFYLDIKNNVLSKIIEDKIKKFGGRVEVFLVESVTHVVSDSLPCGPVPALSHGSLSAQTCSTTNHSVSPNPDKWGGGQRGRGSKSRADAMLERVRCLPQRQSRVPLHQAQLWNIPIWSVQRVKQFLSKIYALAHRGINSDERILKGAYIKFEALDRKSRVIFKEFPVWPGLQLSGEHTSCPFMPLEEKAHASRRPPSKVKDNLKDIGGIQANTQGQSSGNKARMTRKTRPRIRERADIPPKSGYCEICRVDYSVLADHERSPTHISFVKNCSNFLSLDSLISAGADVEAFLKMNKSGAIQHNNYERRSLRNIIKLHSETEPQHDPQKQLEVMCNGASDTFTRQMSPRESRCANQHKLHSPTPGSQVSPALSEKGHYLRSKGPTAVDQEYPSKASPREGSRKEPCQNGSLSPRVVGERTDVSKMNGKLDDKERLRYSPGFRGRKPRSIRWRRPSPEATPPITDNHTYYKVVGMSTKLRSSNNFAPQKESEPTPPPPARTVCNGDSAPGLVVKFRRVRRSELSVLSDEAENFMFPKKDDSDTEDDVETTLSSQKCTSSELLTGSNDGMRYKVKEEVFSGDDGSQDSCESEYGRKRVRRRTPAEACTKENTDYCKTNSIDSRFRNISCSDNANKNKTDTCHLGSDTELGAPEKRDTPHDKCLKWENGRLKASPQIERLTYTFEQVPKSEPWYDTFRRQDEGKEKSKSITEYLGLFTKSPILPYEMSQLPPLKPNCCSLSQVKKPTEGRPGPSRLYGTRGMKKKKIKQEVVIPSGRNSRKSPREHASTLAILGGLVHGRSKHSFSDDSKSLPSIAEEDNSSDATPLAVKCQESTIIEASKQLEELLSSVYDDIEEYDVPMETLDGCVKIEKTTSKPNVIDLLHNYEECEVIDKAVEEIQENIQQCSESRKRRKGHKSKKKNKTGWPNKKKHLKKDTSSTIGSAGSSRDTSLNRELSQDRHSSIPRMDIHESVDSAPSLQEDVAAEKGLNGDNVNSNCTLEHDNSITSMSDNDDNASMSSKCKRTTDTECSHSEDENFSSNVNVDLKQWECAERTLSDRLSADSELKGSIDLQPVVRMQKLERSSLEEPPRRLRSAGTRRTLRARWHPHR